MSGPVFVLDAHGQPLMPMSPAYARKLVRQGKARFQPHYAFTVLQLEQAVMQPQLYPVVLAFRLHHRTAELFLFATNARAVFPLLRLIVDLKTDLSRRMRRRAGHRRRRRARSRYRAQNQFGVPFKHRRPSFMRSAWARQHVRRRPHLIKVRIPTTIRWRVEALQRVVDALRSLAPVSHAIVVSNEAGHYFGAVANATAQRKAQLIEAYGATLPNGMKIARCVYCLTTKGSIEIEHMLPLSRGGRTSWSNTVLACARCNDRKANRTPGEAGMTIQVALVPAPPVLKRASALKRGERLLVRSLARSGLLTTVNSVMDDGDRQRLPAAAHHVIQELQMNAVFDAPFYVVKPIARPRKQRYTARRYAKSTVLRPPYRSIHGAIQRQVRVNYGLAVRHGVDKIDMTVVPLGASIPANSTTFIKIGVLCEGRRNGELVTGIVSAVHSTGRLTLLVPREATIQACVWQRVIIVPRIHIRVRSTNGVLFLVLQQTIGHVDGTG